MKDKIFEIDKITDIANYVKNSLSYSQIIIIGERHHNCSDFMLQEAVVNNLKPKNVLIEVLHAAIYDSNKHELTFRDDDTEKNDPCEDLDEFKHLENGFYYNIAEKYNLKLIGCDLPSCILVDLDLKRMWGYLDENMYHQKRENKMGEIITEYSESFKPLIVVLGNRHVKETSNIYKFIESGYISICIDDICYTCKGEIKDKGVDQCQNCNAIRTIKIKTIGLT